MICPRCDEQGVVLKAEVRTTGEILHVCDECEATWFNIEAIGRDAFVDFSIYMEEIGLPPLWSSIYVLDSTEFFSEKSLKYLTSVGSIKIE